MEYARARIRTNIFLFQKPAQLYACT